ncbi:MAG: sugar ABC transporter permease [Chloroflexota bacterium]
MTAPIAFVDFDALSPPRPVGLDNFREMRRDDQFWNGLKASLILLLIAVPLRVCGALLLALLLRARQWGFGFFRGVAYLPTIIPDVAYALVWLYIFNPLYGPLNSISQMFASGAENELMPAGAPPGIWLTDPRAAQVAIMLMLMFTVGEGFVLLLAGLHEIPGDIYDAAALDGASGFDQVTRITLPLLAPSLILLTVRDTIFVLEASFVAATIVTLGGPYYATSYLPFWIYQNVTDFQRFGYGAAMTWVLFAITLAVVAVQFWVARRWRGIQYA